MPLCVEIGFRRKPHASLLVAIFQVQVACVLVVHEVQIIWSLLVSPSTRKADKGGVLMIGRKLNGSALTVKKPMQQASNNPNINNYIYVKYLGAFLLVNA